MRAFAGRLGFLPAGDGAVEIAKYERRAVLAHAIVAIACRAGAAVADDVALAEVERRRGVVRGPRRRAHRTRQVHDPVDGAALDGARQDAAAACDVARLGVGRVEGALVLQSSDDGGVRGHGCSLVTGTLAVRLWFAGAQTLRRTAAMHADAACGPAARGRIHCRAWPGRLRADLWSNGAPMREFEKVLVKTPTSVCRPVLPRHRPR